LRDLNNNKEAVFAPDIPQDISLVSERCENGPCMKLVKGINLPLWRKTTLEVKSRFGLAGNANLIGENKENPAPNCSIVKTLNNMNLNGFVWIKNACSKNSYKV